MTSEGGGFLNPVILLTEPLPSLDFVPAGVSGGECTAPSLGEPFGDGFSEPAGMRRLLGVVVPDATCTMPLVILRGR